MTPREALAQAVEAMHEARCWLHADTTDRVRNQIDAAISAAEAVLVTPERDDAAEERIVAFIRHEWPDSDTAHRIAASIERGEHRKQGAR